MCASGEIFCQLLTKDRTSVMKQYGTMAATYRLSKMWNENIKKQSSLCMIAWYKCDIIHGCGKKRLRKKSYHIKNIQI